MTHAEILELIVGIWCLASAASYWMADADPTNYRQLGWLWYITAQLVTAFFEVVGWFLLIPFCLAHAWKPSPYPSIKDGARKIDRWSWEPLNAIYGNPDDGVSGQCALIGPTASDPYLPKASAAWRAYCWSALRNSCDQLKYLFAWPNGPQALAFGKIKLGWWEENGYKVLVL